MSSVRIKIYNFSLELVNSFNKFSLVLYICLSTPCILSTYLIAFNRCSYDMYILSIGEEKEIL